MTKNLNPLNTIFGVLAAVLCGTAHADLSFSTTGTVSSYLGSPIYISTAATAAQGNPSLGSGAANYVLSEKFTTTSSFTLVK